MKNFPSSKALQPKYTQLTANLFSDTVPPYTPQLKKG